MSVPSNGIYIIQGEISVLVTAIRRNSRWTSHSHQDEDQDPLLSNFSGLKDVLNNVSDLGEIEPNVFLGPFLDVIRSEDTTGPITGLALSSVNKFLSYGLVDPTSESASAAIENMADAVTHARFVGTDPGSDEVVLMKILQVLRTLLLTPVGAYMTNESVCEIMQSCFRICFEMRLSELLRKSAEHTLVDMVQLLFSRLPQFKDDAKAGILANMKKLKMRAGGVGDIRGKRAKRSPRPRQKKPVAERPAMEKPSPVPELPASEEPTPTPSPTHSSATPTNSAATTPGDVTPTPSVPDSGVDLSVRESGSDGEQEVRENSEEKTEETSVEERLSESTESAGEMKKAGSELDLGTDSEKTESLPENTEDADSVNEQSDTASIQDVQDSEYVNPRGVRFTPQQTQKDGSGPPVPYGLPCVRELFRFLISLTNPYDRGQLKFQLRMYLTKLMDIIVSESPKIPYEMRELSLEAIVQLWRIPGLVTELYLNYDCDLFCSNLFEDLTKLSSQNAFPVHGLYSTHLLSLDALLTVIDAIATYCGGNRVVPVSKQPGGEAGEGKAADEKEGAQVTEGQDVKKAAESAATIPSTLPTTGYAMAGKMEAGRQDREDNKTGTDSGASKTTNGVPGVPPQMKYTDTSSLPTPQQLQEVKQKKRLLETGTEQFNQKPKNGIAYLQKNGLMSTPLDPVEVATFLRENPRLDKKMIADYISDRRNKTVMETYVKSFDFEHTRIDEALRMYLEAFRLPGEAPVISMLLEEFSEHWHNCNSKPFANADAAFTLAYAIIMLNVDQHNHNVKKQNIPMTVEEFKKNLHNVNGQRDFDSDMLDEVYTAIKNDEIVMPDEQKGQVRENYLWKMLLRRGGRQEGKFTHAQGGVFDLDLFLLSWGPSVAALSYVFDKSLDDSIIQKAISGFRKCAMIAAYYQLSDVFDNLVISLCKFTTLISTSESPENLPVVFGSNIKSQMAAKTVFALAHRHGDILREGWKNILDCMLQLYRAKLMPKALIEVEDFVDPSGRISLIREELPSARTDNSIFSSLYQIIILNPEPPAQRAATAEDQQATQQAHNCIKECQVEQLVQESKFLRMESLQELLKALTYASHGPETAASLGSQFDEEAAIFNLELLLRIVLQNKDRIGALWQPVRDHLYSLIANNGDFSVLVERAVVGLLRLAIRLLRREEISDQVLSSLRVLLTMKPSVLYKVCRQLSYGLHELLKTNAANIQLARDWDTLFTLLECVGAGATPPPVVQSDAPVETNNVVVEEGGVDSGAQSDSEVAVEHVHSSLSSDRGYTSDSELYEAATKHHKPSGEGEGMKQSTSTGWLLVGKDDVDSNGQKPAILPVNQYVLTIAEELRNHDPKSLAKCCETLSFLVRDAAHVTPENFESCVHCLRVFVEASVSGAKPKEEKKPKPTPKEGKKFRKKKDHGMKKSKSTPAHLSHVSDDEQDNEGPPGGYHEVCLKLLDLMHTLHTRAAAIFSAWAEEEKARRQKGGKDVDGVEIDAGTSSLWNKCWCPLLQGIARLCCDSRRQVRTSAITYLQRALLVHDLQTLSAVEWESCFNKVLFPLLTKLLENISPDDTVGMEETRMRVSALLCKVFLQHLGPLLSLSTFTALWLTILDFMDKYMHVDNSDLLFEAIPESLKNMLLVMDTASIFREDSTPSGYTQLWSITWERIECFLPTLRQDVFKEHHKDHNTERRVASPPPPPPSPPTVVEQPQPSSSPEKPRSETPVQPTPTPEPTAKPTQTPSKDSPQTETPPTEDENTPPLPTFILQPPLPAVYSPGKPNPTDGQPPAVPIVLNPEVIQGTPIPILAPQEAPPSVTTTSN
ncbi:Golgi-specific brefeldin A-resistance guanine nucleotide exchange factor 1-like [Branchiostoma floridae]|uniref:Golgi-specific brefeldin A-resistance guanine nucleotide exchange factor 1-like n=1 Tax=Branchiostoma floridae TaxID=7739 RepID=A0A9J7MK24_BRAFL|nr:Golgi-specific brefeldin A-resistance guanine nucleotide exchange factor 1-like [Branchiostoma floridae]